MVLPDSILDAGICAGMTLGAACISTEALRDLHRLLLVRDFRRSGSDSSIAQEDRDAQAAEEPREHLIAPMSPQHLGMALDSSQLLDLTTAERLNAEFMFWEREISWLKDYRLQDGAERDLEIDVMKEVAAKNA